MPKVQRTWRDPWRNDLHVYFEGGAHMKVTGAEADDTDEVVLKRVFQDHGTLDTMKRIMGHRMEDGQLYYKVWWNKYLKRQATWEPHAVVEQQAPLLVQAYKMQLQ
jgi:hypothetical protein